MQPSADLRLDHPSGILSWETLVMSPPQGSHALLRAALSGSVYRESGPDRVKVRQRGMPLHLQDLK